MPSLPRVRTLAARALQPRLARLGLICADVDGTLTDGRIVMLDRGELRSFSARDGMGVQMAATAGIPVVWISRKITPSRAVQRRADELGVELHQGRIRKEAIIADVCRRHRVEVAETAFLGDDVQDLPAFAVVGLSVAVADALPEVRAAADACTQAIGGGGALRELVDAALHARDGHAAVLREMLGVECDASGRARLVPAPSAPRAPRKARR